MNCSEMRKGRNLHNRGCDRSLIRKYILMNGNPYSFPVLARREGYEPALIAAKYIGIACFLKHCG